MKNQKTILKQLITETNRLEKKGEDLSYIHEAVELVNKDEAEKGVALFLAHQPEIVVFEKLRNLVADLVEIILVPAEEVEGKKFNAVPVILEYKDENGVVHETNDFDIKIDQVRLDSKGYAKETVFKVGKEEISEDRIVKKD